MKKILICDGHNIAYRAFFAIRKLSSSKGVPTNAVYGFIRQMESLISKINPDSAVVVFDGGIPDYRLELLDSYKAQRPHMPEEMRPQMSLIGDYLRYAQFHSVCLDGQEADDVIATLVSKASMRGVEQIVLATSDKDMFQLVSNEVFISLPKQDRLMGPAEVRNKTGVDPSQILDWLALIGDSADNIPGVRGVGPKTAAKLLSRYSDIGGILANIEDVEPPHISQKIVESREIIERNLKIMSLDSSVDMEIDWDSMIICKGDELALIDFYDELEFRGLAQNLREPRLL